MGHLASLGCVADRGGATEKETAGSAGPANLTASVNTNHRMADAGPGVLAPAASGVVKFIERDGGDVDAIFGRAGIAPQSITDLTLSLQLGSYCALFEEAARTTQNDNFGLWFGNQFAPQDLGLLGYVAVVSPTVGSALDNFVNLFHFHQQGSAMALVERDHMMALQYQIHDGRIIERRQDAELSLGMFFNVIREGHGADWAPEEVHFEHPKPFEWREHERAFNAPVYFNQPTNALLFREDDLFFRMPNSDPRLLAVVQTCLSALGLSEARQTNAVDRFRNHLRVRLPEGYPLIDSMAAELGLAVSTVRRALAQEGLSYKALVEATRQELSVMYLRQIHLPLSEIAFLLGYSELSAFSRAFRRWYDASPREYRDRLLNR